MTDSDYAIRADGLTKRYGAIRAVENVSLRVGRGEIYAFLGLNGAGKTTTIRMLLSMIRPSAGMAFLLGLSRVDRARESGGLPPPARTA
jgi:ABC-2 type transport system ATP-binding protein